MQNPMLPSSYLEKPRKRLKRRYHRLGTWRKLADVLSEEAGFPVNVRYPWEFVVKGIIPPNKLIRRALGIPRRHAMTMEEVNKHLREDAVQDMPSRLLAWALENREELKEI